MKEKTMVEDAVFSPFETEESEFIEVGIREAANFLENVESALVVCHVSPDGDAVGSARALVTILRKMGKKAKAVAPSPVPASLAFLKGDESFCYEKGEEDLYGAVITVDVASISQLGQLSHLANITDFMIDHHAAGEAFADNLTVKDASAAGEIVAEIYSVIAEDGEIERCPDISSFLYAAISADTGNFKYSNTSPKTLRTAAELMEDINNSDEIKADEISRLLHDTLSESDFKVFALVTGSLKKYEDGSLVGAVLTSAKIKLAGLEENELGGAVDITRKVEGALVGFVLKQSSQYPTQYKLSVRANAEIDVASACKTFGGGGHVRAAGATVTAQTPGKALDLVLSALTFAVAEYKERNGGAVK